MVSFFSSVRQQHRNTDVLHDPPLVADRIAHVDKIVRPLANVGRWPRRLHVLGGIERSPPHDEIVLSVGQRWSMALPSFHVLGGIERSPPHGCGGVRRWTTVQGGAVGNVGASRPPAALSRCGIVEERGAGKEGVVVKRRHCIRRGGGVVVVLFLGCFYRATPGRPARGHILI